MPVQSHKTRNPTLTITTAEDSAVNIIQRCRQNMHTLSTKLINLFHKVPHEYIRKKIGSWCEQVALFQTLRCYKLERSTV